MFKLALFCKILITFTINLLVSYGIYASAQEQKQLDFPIKIEELMNKKTHYYYEVISPREIVIKYPSIFDLDSLSLIQESNVDLILSKAVNVVEKPVGFFEEQQLTDKKFLEAMLSSPKVTQLNSSLFLVEISRDMKYKMQFFFDADDLSNLPNSKVVKAVAAAKRLDIISQGANSIVFIEKKDFSHTIKGGVTVSSYIPVKENRTLVITYNLWATVKGLNHKSLKKDFLQELEHTHQLMEKFDP